MLCQRFEKSSEFEFEFISFAMLRTDKLDSTPKNKRQGYRNSVSQLPRARLAYRQSKITKGGSFGRSRRERVNEERWSSRLS